MVNKSKNKTKREGKEKVFKGNYLDILQINYVLKMASKRKVTQDDLRKMMAEMKSNPSSKSSSSKKMKLSSRELALLEEEKRQKALRDQEKIRLKQDKMARIVPNKDLQPKKSILKNSSTTSNYIPPQYVPQKKTVVMDSVKEKVSDKIKSLPTKEKVIESHDDTSAADDEESGQIPEGFFDDPKLDAKARQVQYVNVEEEEWQKFQKEIADAENDAQDILIEDRNEATNDRQIEEIDEQMRQWKRYVCLSSDLQLRKA